MLNIRPFQIVLLAVFAVFAIGGVIFFMLYQGSGGEVNDYGDRVLVWGTFDGIAVNRVLNEVARNDKNFNVVEYVEKSPSSFNLELLNAVAEGRSPDLIMLQSDSLVTHRTKLRPISYDTISARTFRDRYIDGAEIFLQSDGIYGIPFAVDPLVMYWNRDVFSSNGLASPPTTWEELLSVTTPAITRVGGNRSILQSAVAFGEYENISHAKDILSLLFLQSGTDIVSESDGRYQITLRQAADNGLPPAEAALSFYTRFAIPSSNEYSWSRALPQDRLQFIAGDLGLYFGFGSEYTELSRSNPNLNFDIAPVPQGASAGIKRGFGHFYAFAIPRASQNPQGAYTAASVLASQNVSAVLTEALNLAPVQRSTISAGAVSPYRQALYTAALISRTWLDPNPVASENTFKLMIEDVTSGRERVSKAIADAIGRLELMF